LRKNGQRLTKDQAAHKGALLISSRIRENFSSNYYQGEDLEFKKDFPPHLKSVGKRKEKKTKTGRGNKRCGHLQKKKVTTGEKLSFLKKEKGEFADEGGKTSLVRKCICKRGRTVPTTVTQKEVRLKKLTKEEEHSAKKGSACGDSKKHFCVCLIGGGGSTT